MARRFTNADLQALEFARHILEKPSFIARITNLIGQPLEQIIERLPEQWKKQIFGISHKALSIGLDYAIRSLGAKDQGRTHHKLHKFLVSASGAVGGFLGPTALAVELPISTCIMLRSIAEIARSEGHDIDRPETRLACMEVLALGGRNKHDDASEQGYWMMRAYLAQTFSDAVVHITRKGLTREGGPIVARFVAKVASRFGQYVTEEMAVKSLPVVGAILGGGVNLLFINHFQDMARGHFIIKRLEDKYGQEMVEKKYLRLALPERSSGHNEADAAETAS